MDTLVIDPSISGALLGTIIVFILLIGSFFSMSVLRFFQQRARAGITYMASFAASIAIFVYVLNTWS